MRSDKRNQPEDFEDGVDDVDEDDDANEDDRTEQETETDRDEQPRVWFYPMPLGKFVLFGVIGSTWFCVYWMYRCWRAYRDAWGYSKRDFWERVHAKTGFRISPFWRSVLSGSYCFALFPAVQRESKAARLPGLGAPIVLALLFNFLGLVVMNAEALTRLLFTPAWAILPVQLTINRLNTRAGLPIASRSSAAEIAFVVFGALGTCASLWGGV
jgi:hypothetical protein